MVSDAKRRIRTLQRQLASTASDGALNEPHFEVVVIGAGFSGLLCSVFLKDEGVESVRVFEMSPTVGGVWFGHFHRYMLAWVVFMVHMW